MEINYNKIESVFKICLWCISGKWENPETMDEVKGNNPWLKAISDCYNLCWHCTVYLWILWLRQQMVINL